MTNTDRVRMVTVIRVHSGIIQDILVNIILLYYYYYLRINTHIIREIENIWH